MSAAPSDALSERPGSSRALARAVDAALARTRSGDPSEVAYVGACRAMLNHDPDLSPLAGPDDYQAAWDSALWAGAEAALESAGYWDHDVLDFYDDVAQAQSNGLSALQVAADGGGSEAYAAARSFANAATAPQAPISVPTACSNGRHRRAPGAAPGRRQGSRRTPSRSAGGGSSDPDLPDEPADGIGATLIGVAS